MKCGDLVIDNTSFWQLLGELMSIQFFAMVGGCLLVLGLVEYILTAANVTKFSHHVVTYGVMFTALLAMSLYTIS